MKKNFLAIILGSIFIGTSLVHAETMQFTTYYPAPFGAYTALRLVPAASAPVACNSSNGGTLYVDSGTGNLLICNGSTSLYTALGGWSLNGSNNLYANNWNTSTFQVGIRTANPGFTLDLGGTGAAPATIGGVFNNAGNSGQLFTDYYGSGPKGAGYYASSVYGP